MGFGYWLLTALLVVVGLGVGDAEGAPLLGALLGALLGVHLDLRARLGALERRLAASAPTPRAAPTPAAADAAPPPASLPDAAPTVATAAAAEPAPAPAPAAMPAAAVADPWQGAAAAPAGPGPAERLVGIAWGWLSGGNALVRVGLLVLFFGVAFLLRYVAEHTQLSIAWRLAGVAAGGLALLGLGWRLRTRRPAYALSLQGGGIGIVYLTLFAAMQFYGLLDAGPTFVVLVACTAAAGALGVVQNAQALVLLAAVGGFLAPVLVSTGAGDHVVLFGYYLVLDLGILAVAWFRAWRGLNLVGFAFTFVIGALWGGLRYRPELLASTEPFLVAFFGLYTAVAVLYALRQPPARLGWVDGTLVFGVPVVAFPLQAALVAHVDDGMAWSALAIGAFYALLQAGLRRRPGLGLLAECYLALAVAFATVAIPLGLDSGSSAPLWALEGAALVWVGARQQRWPVWAFGLLVQAGAGVLRLDEWLRSSLHTSSLPFFDQPTLSDGLLAVAGVASACWLWRARPRHAPVALMPAALAWGLAWWFAAGAREGLLLAPLAQGAAWWPGFLALGVGLASALHGRLRWHALLAPLWLHLPLLAATLAWLTFDAAHPLARGGALGWPLALAAYVLALRRLDAAPPPRLAWLHAGGLWLVVALFGAELPYQVGETAGLAAAWPLASLGAWLAAVTAALAAYRGTRWPFAAHAPAYRGIGLAPLPVALVLWWLASLPNPAAAPPLPWLPLLNPLELAVLAMLAALAVWRRAVVEGAVPCPAPLRPWLGHALAALAFISGNATLLRAVHHYAGVAYDAGALWQSRLAQAAVAVAWALAGVALMLVAARRARRAAWLAGAGLLGAVVLKLFAVDLSGRDTLERIVAFLAVGALLLLVGWFAPVPPRAAAAGDDDGRGAHP
ncbi:putative membrane protein [Plasticicumulans lactativorans]|uniref:Putative membrane protein n=1 Tax=Plasticicumulans lactativorans TaxID=1133106 RepID=A0A4R2L0Z4_9GAMM|nr:DUF2339 domain-containing protein [Plasticicumulans lactativorans]TCO78847.1 putative membrane protein [Plasticicumulans lactativorans]